MNTATTLEWTNVRGQNVIVTEGMIDGATGKTIYGLFASDEDARSIDADDRAVGTVAAYMLTPEQREMAARNSDRLSD
jgi:hypothetical protein